MTLKPKEICDRIIKISGACKNEDFSFLDINWLARKFGCSPSYISRVFSKEKKMYLKHYLAGIRISRSVSIIENQSDLSTREIAKQLDYSYSHFIREFKMRMGLTPGKYRSQLKLARQKRRRQRAQNARKMRGKTKPPQKTKPKNSRKYRKFDKEM